jgi:hypothetical protein
MRTVAVLANSGIGHLSNRREKSLIVRKLKLYSS